MHQTKTKILFFFSSSNFRPSLTRAETIESCNSDDLVTVLEMHNRKPYKIIDRKREIKKGVMAESLEELISRGKIFFYQKKALLQKRNEIFLGIFQYYYEISFLNKMYFVYNFEYHYIPMTTKTNWYRKLKAQKELSYILWKIIQKKYVAY